ncbi:MAG TPA: hypothetical protein VGG84_00670 [Gemmatimonadaceae bacterium]
MRLLRVLVAAGGMAALLAQSSAAQEGRTFRDAWFWGVKAGVLDYSSSVGTDNAGAPLVGVDWVITRSQAGLYASYDHSFLNTQAAYREPYAVGDPVVNVRNLRRYTLAAMVFPLQQPTLHPYLGLGVSLHQIAAAALSAPIAIPALAAAAADSIQDKKVTAAPMFMAGIQKRLPMFSVFAQGTGNFVPRGFMLHYVAPKRELEWTLEAGLRYNFGSSIER